MNIQTYIFYSGNGIASDNKPIPPPKLRYRVHGNIFEESFINGGRIISEDIRSILSRHSEGLSSHRRYLDFGCGCARVLRHLFSTTDTPEYFGTDIDPEAIEWNSNKFGDQGSWSINKIDSPIAYENGTFDVVVSVSVFTHLNEKHQNYWLDEIWENHDVLISKMENSGVYFLHKYVGFWRFNGLPDFYQVTFHSKTYIYENWSRYFDIAGYEKVQ